MLCLFICFILVFILCFEIPFFFLWRCDLLVKSMESTSQQSLHIPISSAIHPIVEMATPKKKREETTERLQGWCNGFQVTTRENNHYGCCHMTTGRKYFTSIATTMLRFNLLRWNRFLMRQALHHSLCLSHFSFHWKLLPPLLIYTSALTARAACYISEQLPITACRLMFVKAINFLYHINISLK